MRILGMLAAGLLALYLFFLAGVYWVMTRPPARIGAAVARMPGPLFLIVPFKTLWFRARAGAVQVGDAAPDFRLPTLDRKAEVSLASFRGARPVVLIFGSYT